MSIKMNPCVNQLRVENLKLLDILLKMVVILLQVDIFFMGKK